MESNAVSLRCSLEHCLVSQVYIMPVLLKIGLLKKNLLKSLKKLEIGLFALKNPNHIRCRDERQTEHILFIAYG